MACRLIQTLNSGLQENEASKKSGRRVVSFSVVSFVVSVAVSVPEEVSMDDFIDNFIAFIEENGWSFGGGYRTIIDGYYINEDGTKGEGVLDT